MAFSFSMNVHLQQVLPDYFEENKKSTSEIWGKDIVFQKGAYVKIVAPSGSGKTSLIHFLYGLRNQYKGLIAYDDHDVKRKSKEEIADYRARSISIVFQDLKLFSEQTVWENIDIKRQLNPHHPSEKIKEMCERLGIGNKLSTKTKICSYGEQQRIAIIRSLMQPFDILLLDEPFSHLDNANAEKAMALIVEEAKERGATIVFADLERVDFFPYSQLYHL